MVKQVGLLAAGCQPWNRDVCVASGNRFAYCATLSIYIYERDERFNEFRLLSIMSEHKKTIMAICWSLKNQDVFASSSADNRIIVWNIADEKVVAVFDQLKAAATSIAWCYHDWESVSFVQGRGPLFIWNCNVVETVGLTTVKEAQFSSVIIQFRWHSRKLGKVAFGHGDGSISIITLGQKGHRHVLRPIDGSNEDDPVTDLEWDPLSTDYLLVSNMVHGVRLLDTVALSVIMTFQLPSAAAHVHAISWIHNAPGMFLTGDSHAGVMRVWNVSKATPIENITVKKTGFHTLSVITNTPLAPTVDNSTPSVALSSTSEALPPAFLNTSNFALPPSQVVCTFLDGGVGLYDLGTKSWNFLRDQGHIETIFDCKFKSDDPDLLATGSFDGTIKVWDINTMTAVHTSPGNEGVIYSLSWAPVDLNCIAAATSRNGVFIWDIDKGKIIKRYTEHGKASVYCVAWNQKDSRRIMSSAADGVCVIRQIDGTVLQKYKHPAPVFGCDWSPNNKDILATGCDDKCVRVYYVATTSNQPLKIFCGHTSKVFHVKWSPLRDGILCSGSDDGTIRLWDYTREECVSVLSGHSAPVRGLFWNTEIPYLLISGGWDYAIRIWDTRDGACLETILDHGADVYGLTCHPSRPFLLASCSRDSTLRLWTLNSLIQPIEMNIIAGKDWSEVLGTPEQAMSLGTPPLLTGMASKDLRHMIDNLGQGIKAKTLRLFSKFFSQPTGTDNLWELVSVIKDDVTTALGPNYSKGIVHASHATKYKSSEAQELEMVRMAKHGGGIGAPSREERLREAARIHIRLGNIQRYCELMVELGEWKNAIAVSPGASIQYWRSLTQRYADYLIKMDDDSAIPFCVAAGSTERLMQFLTAKGQLRDALLVSQVASEGSYPVPVSPTRRQSIKGAMSNGYGEAPAANLQLRQRASDDLAEWYFTNGSPIVASCCHLADDNCQKALTTLLRGHELELAVSIAAVLGDSDESIMGLKHIALQLLSRRCEHLGKWDLAVDLLKLIPDSLTDQAKLCARCSASMSEINLLHEKAGILSIEDCTVEAEKLKNKPNVFSCVMYYMLSASPELGLELGLDQVKQIMSGDDWCVDQVWSLLQMMSAIKTERLQQHKCDTMREELLVLTAYIGALVAIRRQYDAIVPALFSLTSTLLKRDNVNVSLSCEQIQQELSAWESKSSNTSKRSARQIKESNVNLDNIYHGILRKAGTESSLVGVGVDCVASSHLPSHSDVHVSCITGQRIMGLAYFLEDGKSAISINEALMWAKVNPFSPLGSGLRINPF